MTKGLKLPVHVLVTVTRQGLATAYTSCFIQALYVCTQSIIVDLQSNMSPCKGKLGALHKILYSICKC